MVCSTSPSVKLTFQLKHGNVDYNLSTGGGRSSGYFLPPGRELLCGRLPLHRLPRRSCRRTSALTNRSVESEARHSRNIPLMFTSYSYARRESLHWAGLCSNESLVNHAFAISKSAARAKPHARQEKSGRRCHLRGSRRVR